MRREHRRYAWWALVAWCCGLGLGCSSSNDVGEGAPAVPKQGTPAAAANDGAPSYSGASAAAGSGPAAGTAGAVGGEDTAGMEPAVAAPEGTAGLPEVGAPMAMDECGLDTRFAGDEYCILPPPPDQGFQLHIGPSNYDNPEPQYILGPGQELTSDFPAVSGNDTPVHFYYRQYRQRPGAHHNIITAGATGGLAFGFALGHRIGTSNLLAEDNPKGRIVAPENEGVGVPLEANSSINVSLHSINVTDEPELREVWINFWYVDESKVTEEAQELFQLGDPLIAIAPGADTILGPYSCTIGAPGRMLWFYGHRHANNVRFSAWRVRGTQRDLFYEGLYWEDPLVLEFSSTVQNATPDEARGIEGGWSGILDLEAGDRLEWECHVINETSGTLRFSNNTYTGEMCIMDGELIGTNCR